MIMDNSEEGFYETVLTVELGGNVGVEQRAGHGAGQGAGQCPSCQKQIITDINNNNNNKPNSGFTRRVK